MCYSGRGFSVGASGIVVEACWCACNMLAGNEGCMVGIYTVLRE